MNNGNKLNFTKIVCHKNLLHLEQKTIGKEQNSGFE